MPASQHLQSAGGRAGGRRATTAIASSFGCGSSGGAAQGPPPLLSYINNSNFQPQYPICSSLCPSLPISTTLTNTTTTSRTLHSTPNKTLFNQQLNNRKMSTIPAQHGHSEACCNVPAVISKGYDAKGSYEELGGFKTCMISLSIYQFTMYLFFSSFPDFIRSCSSCQVTNISP